MINYSSRCRRAQNYPKLFFRWRALQTTTSSARTGHEPNQPRVVQPDKPFTRAGCLSSQTHWLPCGKFSAPSREPGGTADLLPDILIDRPALTRSSTYLGGALPLTQRSGASRRGFGGGPQSLGRVRGRRATSMRDRFGCRRKATDHLLRGQARRRRPEARPRRADRFVLLSRDRLRILEDPALHTHVDSDRTNSSSVA
jgi:hypothetical protein